MEPDDVNKLLECLDLLVERLDSIDDALRDHTASISSLERAIRDVGAGTAEALGASANLRDALSRGAAFTDQSNDAADLLNYIADRIREGK